MTRIIGGRAGSLPLTVPDAGTRPTSDRVRESLFGGLDAADALSGAAVLDLYAGSGALGLESVSRGARSADLVEKNARAADVARRNAATVTRAVPGGQVRVHRQDAATFLRSAAGSWDVVFLDPPYGLAESALLEVLELLGPRLTPDATVILERATRSGAPDLPATLALFRDKRYGDTTLWWLHPTQAGGV